MDLQGCSTRKDTLARREGDLVQTDLHQRVQPSGACFISRPPPILQEVL